jgi:eukaryotic-like serine/threonine-protein kinase
MSSSLPRGVRLGRYEIRSKIGAGGMGEVYLAQDTRLDRKVALKILPAEVASQRERMERFVREAKSAAALNHPHVAHIYEIAEADGLNFIAMEFIEGETLREKIYHDKTELKELLKYLQQVAEGLAKAHVAGIVHRDLKPDNIMITRDGYAQILDFGLAKLVEPEGSLPAAERVSSEVATALLPQASIAGTVMGTVGYMSPEQATGRIREIDHRSDIFSFGCILFEAATGQKAFAGKDALDSLHRIVHGPTPQIKDLNPSAPDELQRIIRRCLAKEPDQRYHSIKDVAIELEELRQELKNIAHTAGVASTPSWGDARMGTAGAQQSATGATAIGVVRPTSSAEYVVAEIKRHKRAALLALAAVLVASIAVYAYVTRSSSAAKEISSVAVLPFANGGGDSEMEYLSDGISESVINKLSQLPQLKVIARGSSFKFKGRDVDYQEVARVLGVQAIVTGRVVQRGDQLQVSVEMVDAANNRQLWGEQYNRSASDLLRVQSDISGEIAERLRLKLTNAEERQLAKRETANPEAYELLLKARFYHERRGSTEDLKKAVAYYEQAVAADPNFAVAYAELALDYQSLSISSVLNPAEGMPKALAATRRALDLDQNLAEAHVAMAFYHRAAWEWADAEREYERAIELSPNYVRAHVSYSVYLSLTGRNELAIAEAKRAKELDPLSARVNMSIIGALQWAHQYDQAIEASKKLLEVEQNAAAHGALGEIYTAKGMYRQAIDEYLEARRLGVETPETQVILGVAYVGAGEREKALEIRKRLETGKEYISPTYMAILHAALGDRERAFASLEKAYAAHDPELSELRANPGFDSLRSDSRFQDLLRRVGLPQ